MEKNYKFVIAYDGTRFFGWEHQPDKETIQGKLEAVLERLQGRPVDLIGAGRTDAGVHARAMVASVRLDVRRSPDRRGLRRGGQGLSLALLAGKGDVRHVFL